jgi:hypothetical protein
MVGAEISNSTDMSLAVIPSFSRIDLKPLATNLILLGSPQGPAIGVARIDLSYKNEEIPTVTKDVANAHCMQFIKRIFENRGVFRQMSGCELSHNKKQVA